MSTKAMQSKSQQIVLPSLLIINLTVNLTLFVVQLSQIISLPSWEALTRSLKRKQVVNTVIAGRQEGTYSDSIVYTVKTKVPLKYSMSLLNSSYQHLRNYFGIINSKCEILWKYVIGYQHVHTLRFQKLSSYVTILKTEVENLHGISAFVFYTQASDSMSSTIYTVNLFYLPVFITEWSLFFNNSSKLSRKTEWISALKYNGEGKNTAKISLVDRVTLGRFFF